MEELLTVDEAAKIVKASRVTVYGWVRDGLIPVVRRITLNSRRSRIFLRKSDLLALFKEV